jgi:hypothetical protein
MRKLCIVVAFLSVFGLKNLMGEISVITGAGITGGYSSYQHELQHFNSHYDKNAKFMNEVGLTFYIDFEPIEYAVLETAFSTKRWASGVSAKRGPAESVWNEWDLTISLLGKFPFQIQDNILIYPLVGPSLEMGLSQFRNNGTRDMDRHGFKDTNDDSYWLKLGLGSDWNFSEKIRLELRVFYDAFMYNEEISNSFDLDFSNTKFNTSIRVGYSFM